MDTANKKLFEQYMAEQGQMPCLQLGSGPKAKAGWLNTDIKRHNPKIFELNAASDFPFDAATFAYVYCEHMIEHMTYQQGLHMLREVYRVLKPGGVLRLVTPSIQFLLNLFSQDRSQVEEKYIEWQH